MTEIINWFTKKRVLLISFFVSTLFLITSYLINIKICFDTCKTVSGVFFIFVPVFILSIIFYLTPESFHSVWVSFLKLWIPLSVFILFFSTSYGFAYGDYTSLPLLMAYVLIIISFIMFIFYLFAKNLIKLGDTISDKFFSIFNINIFSRRFSKKNIWLFSFVFGFLLITILYLKDNNLLNFRLINFGYILYSDFFNYSFLIIIGINLILSIWYLIKFLSNEENANKWFKFIIYYLLISFIVITPMSNACLGFFCLFSDKQFALFIVFLLGLFRTIYYIIKLRFAKYNMSFKVLLTCLLCFAVFFIFFLVLNIDEEKYILPIFISIYLILLILIIYKSLKKE